MSFEEVAYLVFFVLGCVTQLVSHILYVQKLNWLDRVFAERLIRAEVNINVENQASLLTWKDEQGKFVAKENGIRLALLVLKMFGLGVLYVIIGAALHQLFW